MTGQRVRRCRDGGGGKGNGGGGLGRPELGGLGGPENNNKH